MEKIISKTEMIAETLNGGGQKVPDYWAGFDKMLRNTFCNCGTFFHEYEIS